MRTMVLCLNIIIAVICCTAADSSKDAPKPELVNGEKSFELSLGEKGVFVCFNIETDMKGVTVSSNASDWGDLSKVSSFEVHLQKAEVKETEIDGLKVFTYVTPCAIKVHKNEGGWYKLGGDAILKSPSKKLRPLPFTSKVDASATNVTEYQFAVSANDETMYLLKVFTADKVETLEKYLKQKDVLVYNSMLERLKE